MSFSFLDRNKTIDALSANHYDLVVVGGGISGAGVARDAASRGMKVALVEAKDFASGTSSRSSKLIHGGIRYLENLEFGLVFEALSERRNLFEMAPHLVHPLRFILPLYKDSRVGMIKLGLGMMLYDLLSSFEMPESHERLNISALKDRLSILDERDLVGGYAYSDAYMDDDRLTIETLRSAANMGATCVNYVKVIGADQKNWISKLQCKDSETGREFTVSGSHFVSTVGPWTDLFGQSIFGDWKKMMRPSKGIHITLDRKRLPLNDAVVMISEDEKRIVFAIPRHEMIIIGTTDTDFKDNPESVHSSREDVEYLLRVAEQYFPHAKLTEEDILASYSGVRPLVDDGSQTESKTSREHTIIEDPRNVTFLTGGKYTTYRCMAEQTMGVVLNRFSKEDKVRFGKSSTVHPLNELASAEAWVKAKRAAPAMAREFGIDVGTAHMLAERHGLEAYEILAKHAKKSSPQSLWSLEARHAIHETQCGHLLDFYLRRSPLFLSRADHGFLLLQELSNTFAQELSWSDERKKSEINAVRKHLEFEMGWRKSN